jgi:phage-related protein
MNTNAFKDLIWVGDSRKNLCEFPDEVKDEMGYALHLAQNGFTHPNAKLFKIKDDSGIYEIVSNFNTDTFRAIYTVKIDDKIYVLHAFKKKSKSGIKTPKPEVDLIKKRLGDAKILSKSFKLEK